MKQKKVVRPCTSLALSNSWFFVVDIIWFRDVPDRTRFWRVLSTTLLPSSPIRVPTIESGPSESVSHFGLGNEGNEEALIIIHEPILYENSIGDKPMLNIPLALTRERWQKASDERRGRNTGNRLFVPCALSSLWPVKEHEKWRNDYSYF